MSKRKVTNYLIGFKRSSAELAVGSKQPISQTAKDLGINATTLGGWIKEYCPKAKRTTPATEELTAENKRLRKELHRLKQERDILKKAAAYFASETQ